MATYKSYTGSIRVISGLLPVLDYPVVDAHHVLAGDNDKRLSDRLDDMDNKINESIENMDAELEKMNQSISTNIGSASAHDDDNGNVYITYISPYVDVTDDNDGNVVVNKAHILLPNE